MLWMWISLALAQVPGLDAFVEVVPVAQASGGLFNASEAYLQTDQGCLQVTIEHGEVQVPRSVSAALNGEPSECAYHLKLSLTGWTGTVSCVDFDHDDEGAPVRRWPLMEMSSGAPMLVVLDDQRAVWRDAFQVRAVPVDYTDTVLDCSPASLKSLRRQGTRAVGEVGLADWLGTEHRVFGNYKHCMDYQGVHLQRSNPGFSGGVIGPVTEIHVGEHDCRETCPVNEGLRQLTAANDQLRDRATAALG